MAKINVEEIKIGISPMTGEVYAGKLNKKGNLWLSKVNVTNQFVDTVLRKYEGKIEEVENEATGEKWEISVKKIKGKATKKK